MTSNACAGVVGYALHANTKLGALEIVSSAQYFVRFAKVRGRERVYKT